MVRPIAAIVCLLSCCIAAQAGVVIIMESTDRSSGDGGEIDTVYAQDGMLRIDPDAPGSGQQTSMIFRDETLFVVDHRTKVVQRIDREGVEDLAAQMHDVMAHMEAEMAKMPPEQREMMEQRMKQRTPRAMPGMGEELPERRVEAGGSETVAGYDCAVHTVYAGDAIASEVCAVLPGDLPEAQEAIDAFRAMAAFAQELVEAARQGPVARMIDNPYRHMDEVGGFPIRVRTYRDGRVADESTLQSIEAQDLEAGTFEYSDEYQVEDLADQLAGAKR